MVAVINKENSKVYSDKEVRDIFNKYYFLETSNGFIKCTKGTNKTIEVISEREMKYLNRRYVELNS
jgi:hypothetical protein